MQHVTAPRIAILGSLIALLGGALSPVLGFYATLVAAAVLLGAGFLAYITAVDRPSALAAIDLVVCSVVAMLLLADASLRFPLVVSSAVPSASTALAEVALALSVAATCLPGFAWAYRFVSQRPEAERWRRLIDTAF